jgi:outer membrane immunogenic protein
MKKLLLASGALVALIAAGPAMAADQGIRVPAPAYAPVSDWTGFYVGGHVGYGWGHDPYTDNGFSQSAQNNVSGTSVFININPATLTGTDPKGAVGGGHFGYNQQWGNWVGGLEIDISATDMKASTAASSTSTVTTTLVTPFTNTLRTSVSEEDKFDLLGSARARLGGLVWSNTLFYATGGLAWTRFVQSQNATVISTTPSGTAVGTLTTRVPNWMFGWVAGVGGETKIYNSNWLFRVEYLHYDFGDQLSSVGTQVSPLITQNFGRTSGTLTADVVRAGLSYKFGGPIY